MAHAARRYESLEGFNPSDEIRRLRSKSFDLLMLALRMGDQVHRPMAALVNDNYLDGNYVWADVPEYVRP